MEQLVAPSLQRLATQAAAYAYYHEWRAYWIPSAVASLLLVAAALLGTGGKNGDADARFRGGDLFYLLALALFLFATRWPVLALGDLDGDEGVAVSAALTRYLDPAYGVSLFTGSGGPLVTYPIAALGLAGIRSTTAPPS